MAVPAVPTPNFVVVEPYLAFGQLEGVLDCPPSTSRPHYLGEWHDGRYIDQVVGDFTCPLGMAAQEQVVDPAIPQRGSQREIDPVVDARTLCPLATTGSLLSLGTDTGRQIQDTHLPRWAIGRPGRGCLVAADHKHIRLPSLLQNSAKLPIAAVHFAPNDPGRRHTSVQCPLDHLQSQLRLCTIGEPVRYAHLPAPAQVLSPFPGHEQGSIESDMPLGVGIAEEDANLAVGHLAEGAAVLSRHPNRVGALLGKAGLIDDENALGTAQFPDDVAAQVVAHRIGIPGIAVQHPLDAPRVDVPNILCQLPPVLPLDVGEEALEIVYGVPVCLGPQEMGLKNVRCRFGRVGTPSCDLALTCTQTCCSYHDPHLPQHGLQQDPCQGEL